MRSLPWSGRIVDLTTTMLGIVFITIIIKVTNNGIASGKDHIDIVDCNKNNL